MDRIVELKDATAQLAELVRRARNGSSIVIADKGKPVARIAPLEAGPGHRAKETRRRVVLAPEFEPGDARLARIARESEVPYRLRRLPK